MRYRPGADSHRREEPPGGTGALTRVLIESGDRSAPGARSAWTKNVIAASWHALEEAVTYGLLRAGYEPDVASPALRSS